MEKASMMIIIDGLDFQRCCFLNLCRDSAAKRGS